MFSKALSRFILKLWGWKVVSEAPDLDKCVVVGAPHTSNYDFFLMMLFFLSRGMKISFIIKKEALFFPVGGLIKKLGGIPVDRTKKNNLVEQLSEVFKVSKRLFLIISPEGTRSRITHWKKGFYYIAKEANVPLVLAYLDYKYKKMGFGPIYMTSDNADADLDKAKQFFKDINPKHPEMFTIKDE